jgi:hypothetical protein
MTSTNWVRNLPRLRGAAIRCFAPVDIAPLIYFRIVFGLLMTWEIWHHWVGRQLSSLWFPSEFHFKYFGFGWVQSPPGNWIHLLYGSLILSAIGITLGFFYRICATVFSVGFTWLFLIDATQYLNHLYLVCLLGFLLIPLPGNRCLAVDTILNPSLRSDVVPAWTLWLLKTQMALVYIYGGIAKLNSDWLHGEPIRSWLASRSGQSASLEWIRKEWMVGLVSYGGLFFDLSVIPFLLWRRTRPYAFALAVAFHLTNNWLFDIGIFPWLAIALTSLFFEPAWLRSFASYCRTLWTGKARLPQAPRLNCDQLGFLRRSSILAFLALYFIWQILMPLRHFLYPGNVSWTEEGHFFSWHMKLRSKAGDTQFFLLDPVTSEVWRLNTLAYLDPRQKRKMDGHPDLILQFAQYVARLMREAGQPNVEIHVIAH